MKEVLKWGLIVVVALVAWRFLSGIIGGVAGSFSTGASFPQYAPNQYGIGVYGPIGIPQGGNPYNTSPNGPIYGAHRRKRW